jgi:hypothetical protein
MHYQAQHQDRELTTEQSNVTSRKVSLTGGPEGRTRENTTKEGEESTREDRRGEEENKSARNVEGGD